MKFIVPILFAFFFLYGCRFPYGIKGDTLVMNNKIPYNLISEKELYGESCSFFIFPIPYPFGSVPINLPEAIKNLKAQMKDPSHGIAEADITYSVVDFYLFRGRCIQITGKEATLPSMQARPVP